MPSYGSLLVLFLAASTVSPVLSADPAEPPIKEDEKAKDLKPLTKGLGTSISLILLSGLIGTVSFALFVNHRMAEKSAATNVASPTPSSNGSQPAGTPQVPPIPQSTPTPQSTSISQPTSTTQQSTSTPPWVVGPTHTTPSKRERPLGHRSPVEISKARSSMDSIRDTSSHLDLWNRADSGEALDELD